MEASKVSLSADTLQSSSLKHGDKMRLRLQALTDYIQSRPYMAKITYRDLMHVLQVNYQADARKVVLRAEKEGLITRHELGIRKFAYTVNGVVTTKKLDAPKPKKDKSVTGTPPREPSGNIEELARNFAWDQNSDSLREFIKWLQGTKLK